MTFDLPPLWLALFVGVVWLIGHAIRLPVFGDTGIALAVVLVLAGLALMLLAVAEMRRARTTFLPHRRASALVTTGVFRLSRNPIYLGDAALLLAAILGFDAALALPLLPLFLIVIRERFIRDEEAGLRAAFGSAYEEWTARVRRWL